MDTPSIKSRLGGAALVMGLHLALGWALMSGTAERVVVAVNREFSAAIIRDVLPLPPPPEPKAPEPKAPEPKAPEPKAPPPKAPVPPKPALPQVATPMIAVSQPTPAAITQVRPAQSPAPSAEPAVTAEPAPEPVRVSARMAPGQTCRPPTYPPASRRAGETGTVRLKFLIGTQGQVLDTQVERSSGFDRLDEAARDALSLCQFTPGSIDGRPVESWAKLDYVWKIQ